MQFHNFSVTTSGGGRMQELQAEAGYIRFHSISAGFSYPTIEIRTRKGDSFLLEPGSDVRLSSPRDYFTIHNFDAQNTITGVLQIGAAEEKIESDRISGEVSIAGTVEVSDLPDVVIADLPDVVVVDSPAADVMAARCFAMYAEQSGGGASYASGQLWNPAASGKNLRLRRIIVNSTANKLVYVGSYDSALSSLVGAGNPLLRNGASSTAVGQVRKEAAGAPRVTDIFFPLRFLANDVCIVEFPRPIIIASGRGVTVADSSLNQLLEAGFEWDEVDD